MKKNRVFTGDFIEILENSELRNVIGGYDDLPKMCMKDGEKYYGCTIYIGVADENAIEEYVWGAFQIVVFFYLCGFFDWLFNHVNHLMPQSIHRNDSES